MRTLGDIQPGQTLGRYEFLVPIAQGGMAAVWAARLKGSRGFSKNVAVKTMLPSISDDPAFEQMFLDEAQIASRIRHPNVVEILDLGEQDDVLYLVMEWVDGEPLSALRRAAAKHGGIPRPIAVKIVADAAAGLHAAHELKDEGGGLVGLVHRDISPQNVLITFDGVVKIVDFGVAKAAGRTTGDTDAGQIKGKPPYMSPEQALGRDIDRRTDVFALGIILYQLTTGKHPFRGESDMVTLQNIVSDRPIVPPRAYDKQYPKPLETVVMRALERGVDKRFQTADELEAALDRVFPPTVPRVRTEDVGKFMTALLGERGEERRGQLREAVRKADERAAGELRGADDARSADTRPSAPPSQRHSQPSVSQPDLDKLLAGAPLQRTSEPGFGPASGPPTPFGTQTPSAPELVPRSRGAIWLIGGIALAGLSIGAAVIFTNVLAAPAPDIKGAAPAVEPSLGARPLQQAPIATKPPPPASSAIEPSRVALEQLKSRAVAPSARSLPSARRARDEPKPREKKAAEKPKEPPPKKPGGFVPPPLSDPGF